MFFDTYQSPIGKLWLVEADGFLTQLSFSKEKIPAAAKQQETSLLAKTKQQLKEYFAQNLKVFDLPLSPKGTEFQKKVWQALQTVPYGKTVSYKEIAKAVGNEKAVRAVGGANNRNPIALIIPCHRIIGANGNLVGYAGGLEVKEFLLTLEKED
ncbi:MAG: methylated-DNA--[protein]-cysteine S-methyltransferase [Alphaproteobacteria bacterium]|nr:methylated-DNA--[protein]-cysteine S-methyltransferase [Alphaproteobacteria bacterium]